MKTVDVRALKQNASAVLAEAAAGKSVLVTDRGRPVAQIVPVASRQLARLAAAGQLRPAKHSLADLGPAPVRGNSPPASSDPVDVGDAASTLSAVLADMRDDARF